MSSTNDKFVVMKFLKYYVLSAILLLLITSQVRGQRNCGTVEYMNQLGNTESKEVLENWIRQKQIEAPTNGQNSFNVDGITIYQIPVVVHVVHNGEVIGVGSNISDLQIQSQIDVLNEDFRKLNADSINIPAEFKSLYSDIGFEFILAKRDPINQATTGITRIKGSQTSWNLNNTDDIELKSHDYWPSEDYFNIWVAPLCCNWLGWAQFPQSDVLAGLDPPYNAETDGVVITYDAFGSIDKDPTSNLQAKFNLGRTATHEIGHFFGLRHIWGDGGCGVDDYVNDTPIAEDSTQGCPNLGGSTITCGSQDMFMNYMDYVDDNCMNIFSLGQKDRMVIIMENSPRRLSLTKSIGLYPPDSEDLATMEFISPSAGICDDTISTSIIVKNVGLSIITTTNLSLYINDNLIANQNFSIDLVTNQSTELIFNPINLVEFGNLNFKVVINSINGFPDTSIENNNIEIASLRAETVSKLFEDFSTNNSQWTIRSNQELSAIEKTQSVYYSIENNSAVFNYYNSESGIDAYVSPKLAISSNTSTLLFDYAYAYRGFDDKFSVLISTDCGVSFDDILFNAAGENLSTASSPVAFYPSGPQEWQHIQIDLSSYYNQEIIFSFVGESAGGNRILFDNIRVENNDYNDIAMIGLTSPATNCGGEYEVFIEVENKGSKALSDLIITTTQASIISTITYPQLNLLPGKRIDLTLPTTSFQGISVLTVTLPDDDNIDNNSFTQTIISPSSQTQIPLREKFEDVSLTTDWFLIGNKENNNEGWNVNNNQLEFIAENSVAKGLSEMIVLPPLDLSLLNSASMHFNFAYSFNGFDEELLKVKASNDCGATYETLFIQGGEELASNFTTTPWGPSDDSDWKNIYVDLTDYAGSENVQVVIELKSAKGNNAFINQIELYASNIITPLDINENTITAYPNPSSKGAINISFNLSEAQPAKLIIYDAQGSFVYEYLVTNALNQTFEITTSPLRNGIYFARLVGNQVDISRSFMVSN